MRDASEVQYEVPGQDIINKFEERAAAATVVAADLCDEDGHPPEDACNRGMFDAAQSDAERLRLRAKYLDAGKMYTVSASTLADIFFAEKHYAQSGRGLEAAPQMERQW